MGDYELNGACVLIALFLVLVWGAFIAAVGFTFFDWKVFIP